MSKKTQPTFRFAPSPTGHLHIGGARTAIFNWLLAKKAGGRFLLRIEDTDRNRSTKESVDQILTSLNWLGLDWDEPPVYQSKQAGLHSQIAMKLLADGKAYRCFCTRETLQEKRVQAEKEKGAFLYDRVCRDLTSEQIEERLKMKYPFVIRLRVNTGQTLIHDIIRGDVTINHAELDDFVILRSDGSPVYQLAVVVDDHQMGITHVIRGEDHLSNTPKQILIYEAMSWTVPEFAHLPLIHGPDGKRLSKRHGATSVEEFHERGFLAEALFNYLCLLGWAPGDDREILSIEELIQLFSLERVGKKNAIFDQKKLDWVNGKHLSAKSSSDIIRLTASLLNEKDRKVVNADIPAFSKLIDLAKIRAQTFTELMDTISFYFEAPQTYEEKGVDTYFSSLNASDILKKLHNVLNTTESFDEATLETRIRDLADAEGVKAGQLIHPLRLALTGRTTSPGIFEILAILGKSSSLDRLNKAVAFISGL